MTQGSSVKGRRDRGMKRRESEREGGGESEGEMLGEERWERGEGRERVDDKQE